MSDEMPRVELPEILKPKQKKKRERESSMVIQNGNLFEQVWDIDSGSRFVTINDKNPKFLDMVGDIKPIESDALEQGAVLLPTRPEDYGTIDKLINEVKTHIHEYLDISEDYETFATYYILLSWVYDKTNTVAYLRALGDFGTGKSRFLNVIGRLLYKPCIIAGSVTPAPIYRILSRWKGSLIIDEADFGDTSEKSEIITILNAGIERGRPIIRCDKDSLDLKFFDPFGPKILASRKIYADAAFESRCLREVMVETRRREVPRILPNRFFSDESVLRNKLLRFRFDYYDKIDLENVDKIDFGDIEPRLEQISACFLPLFSNVPKIKQKFKKFILGYSERMVIERSETYDGRIINAIVDLMVDGEQYLSATDITNELNKKIPEGSRKISPVTIGRHLRQLGFEFKPTRIGDTIKKVFSYRKKVFMNVIERYIPKDSENYEKIKSVTHVTAVTDYTDSVTDQPNVPKKDGRLLRLVTTNSNNNNINYTSSGNRGSPITTETSVTPLTNWDDRIMSLMSKKGISSEELVEKVRGGFTEEENENFMKDPGRFWMVMERLKKLGRIFEETPGVWRTP
jgi:hypothetical protein